MFPEFKFLWESEETFCERYVLAGFPDLLFVMRVYLYVREK